jgi:tRNA 2-selenouridine synthase SelU
MGGLTMQIIRTYRIEVSYCEDRRELHFTPYYGKESFGKYIFLDQAIEVIETCLKVERYNESIKNKDESCQK